MEPPSLALDVDLSPPAFALLLDITSKREEDEYLLDSWELLEGIAPRRAASSTTPTTSSGASSLVQKFKAVLLASISLFRETFGSVDGDSKREVLLDNTEEDGFCYRALLQQNARVAVALVFRETSTGSRGAGGGESSSSTGPPPSGDSSSSGTSSGPQIGNLRSRAVSSYLQAVLARAGGGGGDERNAAARHSQKGEAGGLRGGQTGRICSRSQKYDSPPDQKSTRGTGGRTSISTDVSLKRDILRPLWGRTIMAHPPRTAWWSSAGGTTTRIINPPASSSSVVTTRRTRTPSTLLPPAGRLTLTATIGSGVLLLEAVFTHPTSGLVARASVEGGCRGEDVAGHGGGWSVASLTGRSSHSTLGSLDEESWAFQFDVGANGKTAVRGGSRGLVKPRDAKASTAALNWRFEDPTASPSSRAHAGGGYFPALSESERIQEALFALLWREVLEFHQAHSPCSEDEADSDNLFSPSETEQPAAAAALDLGDVPLEFTTEDLQAQQNRINGELLVEPPTPSSARPSRIKKPPSIAALNPGIMITPPPSSRFPLSGSSAASEERDASGTSAGPWSSYWLPTAYLEQNNEPSASSRTSSDHVLRTVPLLPYVRFPPNKTGKRDSTTSVAATLQSPTKVSKAVPEHLHGRYSENIRVEVTSSKRASRQQSILKVPEEGGRYSRKSWGEGSGAGGGTRTTGGGGVDDHETDEYETVLANKQKMVEEVLSGEAGGGAGKATRGVGEGYLFEGEAESVGDGGENVDMPDSLLSAALFGEKNTRVRCGLFI